MVRLRLLLLGMWLGVYANAQQIQAKWIVPDEVEYLERTFVSEKPDLEVKIDLSPVGKIVVQPQLRWYKNGKLLSAGGAKLDEVQLKFTANGQLRLTDRLVLSEGESVWECEITIGKNVVRSAPIRLLWTAGKPNLFLISVGVPYRLDYAQRDAAAMHNLFRTQAGNLFGRVQSELLICNEETLKGKIAQTISNLQHERITPADVVILFFSGHGRAVRMEGNLDFGLVTSEAAQGVINEDLLLLSYKQHILKYIEKLPSKKLIMLDACHSGAANGSKSTFGSMAEAQKVIGSARSGVTVISSSSENELSYEDPAWGHGAFTRAFLDGMAGGADASKDGFISLNEISNYLEVRVRELVKAAKGQIQTPRIIQAPDTDYPLFNYRKQAVVEEVNVDRCTAQTESIPESTVDTAAVGLPVLAVVAGAGDAMDEALSETLIGELETAWTGLEFRRGSAASFKNPASEKGQADFVLVVSRQPTVFRQETHQNSVYWVAQTPLRARVFESHTGRIKYQISIDKQQAQGADTDKHRAEAYALDAAIQALSEKKIRWDN